MEKLKKNEEDYVKLLKLYIRLYRGNYENRINFSGILITENRQYETDSGRGRLIREYIIEEIQKLENTKKIKKQVTNYEK